ncbi:MAG: DUF3365 domain-containing protein [Synechococcaceae cyanobacterium]|nr:DUF3365 domain-containing protein [Synechococcaceae cyanobacterium]
MSPFLTPPLSPLGALRAVILALLAALLLALPAPPALALQTVPSPPGAAPVDPAALSRAVNEMEQLDRLRISLASQLEGRTEAPTLQTMKEVCRPVGQRAAAIGEENGWTVRQVATKFRNPDHAPASDQEREVIDLFRRHPGIQGLWEPATTEQGAGISYYRRIDVQPSCLACHGGRDGRPAFVKENYPQDRAFDFRPGDLRGMYAVFLPVAQERQSSPGTQGRIAGVVAR